MLFSLVAGALFYIPYRVMRQAVIEDFYAQEELLATQAAKGISRMFDHYVDELSVLASRESIIHLDEQGRRALALYQSLSRDEILVVARISRDGRILHAVPDRSGLTGRDVSELPHIQRLAELRRPLVSEVFLSLLQVRGVVCMVPVFDGREFVGGLGMLIPLDRLMNEFVTGLRVGQGGYAWVISRQGVGLYSPLPGFAGADVERLASGYPSLLRAVREMRSGRSGRTVYICGHIGGAQGQEERKLAVYRPIPLPENHWAVAVATPEREALASIHAFGRWWWSLLGVLLLCIAGYTVFLVRDGMRRHQEALRREMEKEFLRNERFLRNFINNTSLPIGIARLDGEVELLNSSFQETYGYDTSDIATVDDWFRIAYPDERLRGRALRSWRKRMRETVESGISESSNEWTMRCKDGTYRDIIANYTLIDDRVVITVHDLTERNRLRRAEEELLRKKARARKMEALGLLAGTVAHDLNNILSGIISYPELILARLPRDSDLRPLLEAVRDSGRRAADVVAGLLTIARGATGKRELARLNEVVREYSASPEHFKLMAAHPELSWEMDLAEDIPLISCSRLHVRNCLMNLAANAAEAVRGPGRVTVSTRVVEVGRGEGQLRPGPHVVLAVADTGCGIPEEHVEHIFEPFYSRKEMGSSGTGLGLAMVWNTMVDHEGEVRVQSSSEGTLFELYFPATDRTEAEVPAEPQARQGHGGGHERILVVDDDAQQRDIACQILDSLGYATAAVPSGEEAVEYLQAHEADLVILDMVMDSGMNGLETYRAILGLRPGQRALIVSGYADGEDVRKTLELGASALLAKPYGIEDLARAVREVLDGPGPGSRGDAGAHR